MYGTAALLAALTPVSSTCSLRVPYVRSLLFHASRYPLPPFLLFILAIEVLQVLMIVSIQLGLDAY